MMGYEVPGELAVWFALVTNVLAGISFLLAARGKAAFETLAHRSYHLFVIFASLAVAYLLYLFFSNNFAFKYVYEYSRSAESFLYVLSGLWGGQEGTYLLWLFMNALCGYLILRWAAQYKDYAMAVFSLVNLFFLLILVKLSPFAQLPVPASDGLGLNPLLRDPWMVIHPPVIFAGYAVAAVPFAIAMAALIRHEYTGWVNRVFPWVALSALLIGAGNVLGGYWAYKTLGWGGYWAWDPVENSSFVPWVIALALLHGLIIERRGGGLRRINLLLSAFVFLLVVYGTFLTRSGVLEEFSVHSFTDLGVNVFLVGFMILFTAMTVLLFILRARGIPSAPVDLSYFGREFAMLAALTVLLAFGVIVLFWSSLPILTSTFTAEPRAADIATYNTFALPLAIIMAFLLTSSPYLKFTAYRLPFAGGKVALALAAAAVVGFGLFYFLLSTGLTFSILFTLVVGGMLVYLFKSDLRKSLLPALAVFLITIGVAAAFGVSDYLYLLFFATAAMAATANVISLAEFLPCRWKLMGGEVTHFGFGLMLIGVLASSALGSSEKLVIGRGQSAEADSYGLTVQYLGMVNDLEHPNNELILTLDQGAGPDEIHPQLYFSERMGGIMRKPFIERSLLYDLYLAPEDVQAGGNTNGLTLKKGEARRIGDIKVSFSDFEMGGHMDPRTSGMRVLARVDVEYEGTVSTITPVVVHTEDSTGRPTVISEPARFVVADQEYSMSIERILADEGAVILSIPGLLPDTPADRLVLDVSRKPGINLVWLGTTLILLGCLISVIRRREELVKARGWRS